MVTKDSKCYIVRLLSLGVIIGIGNLSSHAVTAQTIVPLPLPEQRLPASPGLSAPAPTPRPKLPPPEELLQLPASQPTSPSGELGNEEVKITVNRFEVIGSTIFSPEQFAKATAPFVGRSLSFAELLQVRAAITQLYIDAGYLTSGAYLPPQKFDNGIVKINILEGNLEAINITGTRRLNPKYVRDRIALATSAPLNVPRLLEALQLLRLNPLIRNLETELAAGSRTGSNILDVRVTEEKSLSTQVLLDNGRSPSVGTFRRRIQLNEANLLGQGDSVSVAYTSTDGSNGVDFSYTYPLNPHNGTLNFSYSKVQNQVIEAPFNLLDIRAPSREYALTLRQPVIQNPSQEFALGLSADYRESETSLAPLGVPRFGFPLSPGANTEGQTRITALRFFQEWTQRNQHEVLALRSQFSVGIGALGAKINDRSPDGRFFTWRGQGQWVRLLAPDTLLILRTDLQLADRSLVPVEQFSLGGQESVRGYRQDFLLSDNGISGSAELRLPLFRNPKQQQVLQLIPFVDIGKAWNTERSSSTNSTLASVGLGLQWQWSDRFRARLDYGIPLLAVPKDRQTLQEKGLYFSVILNPF